MTTTVNHHDLLTSWLEAVALEPEKALPHARLASVYLEGGNTFAAKLSCEQALELNAHYAEAWVLLGQISEKLRDLKLALEAYATAASLTPIYKFPRARLAALCKDTGLPLPALIPWPSPENYVPSDDWRLEEIMDEAALRQLIASEGPHPGRIIRLAFTLLVEERAIEAECLARYVLSFDPKNPNAYLALSSLADQAGQRDLALKHALHASDLMPTHPLASLLAISASLNACAWDRYGVLMERARAAVAAAPGAGEPAESLFFIDDPKAQAAVASAWGAKFIVPEPQRTKHKPKSSDADQRITIGYMSADFHMHPVGRWMAEVISHHARDQFIIRAYSIWPSPDNPVKALVRASCDTFDELYGLDAATASQKIADDGVDILVDLTGYTLHARTDIMGYQPAPVQVSYGGFLGTLGVPFIQYQVVDATVGANPERLASHEQLVRLPYSMLAGDRHRFVTPAQPLARKDVGLPENAVVFCNFSFPNRLNPTTFEVWARILKRVPGSVLWLARRDAESSQRILREAVVNGLSSNRIIVSERTDYADYLQRLACADLFLDTLPHNAGAVAMDALWMGCPVLTCTGDVLQSRIGAGMARAAGVPELVTDTLAAYEDTAVSLGQAPAELAALKKRLNAGRDTQPMYNPVLLNRHLEWAYRAMWDRHKKGQAPALIDVPQQV